MCVYVRTFTCIHNSCHIHLCTTWALILVRTLLDSKPLTAGHPCSRLDRIFVPTPLTPPQSAVRCKTFNWDAGWPLLPTENNLLPVYLSWSDLPFDALRRQFFLRGNQEFHGLLPLISPLPPILLLSWSISLSAISHSASADEMRTTGQTIKVVTWPRYVRQFSCSLEEPAG